MSARAPRFVPWNRWWGRGLWRVLEGLSAVGGVYGTVAFHVRAADEPVGVGKGDDTGPAIPTSVPDVVPTLPVGLVELPTRLSTDPAVHLVRLPDVTQDRGLSLN